MMIWTAAGVVIGFTLSLIAPDLVVPLALFFVLIAIFPEVRKEWRSLRAARAMLEQYRQRRSDDGER